MTITQKKRCSKIFLVTPKRRTYGKSRNTFLRPHPVIGTVWIYIYGIKLPYPAFLCKFLHHKSYFRRCGPVFASLFESHSLHFIRYPVLWFCCTYS